MRRLLKRLLMALLLLGAVLTIIFLAGPRVTVAPYTAAPVTLPEDLEAWLQARESQAPALRPGLEKNILWADPAAKARTRDALIYLHGFSASRGELSPVVETLGSELKANVFFTRLHGHGQDGEAMGEATVHRWFDDAEEALAIGKRLGERVTVIGLSTGATLGLWLASRHPELHAQVLLSPNFGPKDSRANLLLLPWGNQLAHALVGDYRSWKPDNALHARYWTTRYRVEALLQMMALVDTVNRLELPSIRVPTLMIYTPNDTVLDTSRIPARFADLGATDKKLIALKEATDHVLAGDALGPGTTGQVVGEIAGFLRGLEK